MRLQGADSIRFVFVFFVLHLMVFIFGMMTYGLAVRLILKKAFDLVLIKAF